MHAFFAKASVYVRLFTGTLCVLDIAAGTCVVPGTLTGLHLLSWLQGLLCSVVKYESLNDGSWQQ